MRKKFFSVIAVFAAIATAAEIPSDGLVADFTFNKNFENAADDGNVSAENHGATFASDRFGNENSAAYFDGDSAYLEIPDNDALSISTTGALTISVWMSPEVLDFKNAESGGYVHWMGKGEPHQHEWVFRMYNKNIAQGENRPNRISAYAFNLDGGLGAGSYVQETVTENEWIHLVARFDTLTNKISLYKNGVKKDEDELNDATYNVHVQNGSAPLRLGTRSKWSFFQGRIDDLRIYSRALNDHEILALYNEPYNKIPLSIRKIKKNHSAKTQKKSGKFYDLNGREVRVP